ncbi:MAG: DUF4912 domain-containing protein [Methylococcales bacterium]|nr:DUF4912 domain-containing protein [Methylococcales bacterium]
MLEISQEINSSFAPSLSTYIASPANQHKLSPQEMFDISEEIRLDFAPKASNNPQELVLLPVDPNNIYAYWNLVDDTLNAKQKNDSGNQLTLRVYSEPDKNMDSTKTRSWFDVAIDRPQAQQKIPLPLWSHETAYFAAIGKRHPNNSLSPFASSNITQIPTFKAISNQVKDSQIMVQPITQRIPVSQKITTHHNDSASGQGIN